MTTNSTPLDSLIDRLVEGELPEAERRDLLTRLEQQPDGWRCCAFAFLEAQSWRQAFAPLGGSPKPDPLVGSTTEVARPRRFRLAVKWTLLAASLLGVFALGWLLRSEPEARVVEIVRTVTVPSQVPPREEPPKQPEPLDVVVRDFENRGYFAEKHQRSVSLKLQDGRKFDVPVQEVRLKNVSNRTY